MQQRNGYIVAGIIGAMLTLLVVLLGVGGWLVWSTRITAREISDLQATIMAQAEPTPQNTVGVAQATPTIVSAAVPTAPALMTPIEQPTSAAPTEVAADAVTPTSEMAAPTDRTATLPSPDLPAAANVDFASALAANSRDALAKHPDAPVYRIGARFDPEARMITGRETIVVTNAEDVPLNELYLRLYPNAPFYRDGGIDVSNVSVAGQPAQTALEVDDTALKIALAQPLAVGQSVEVALDFVTTVPEFGAGYGIFGIANGVYALYNWHPELDVYEDGAWLLNPVGEQGDPTNTDVANYQVVLTTTEDVKVVTSGVEAEPRAGATPNAVEHVITSALTRNFVMVLSDRLLEASQQAGDVTVTSYYLEGDEDGGKLALEAATRSIELFSKAFGAYPYPELDVAEVKLGGGAAGMESTGLILIGSDQYNPDTSSPLAGLEVLVPGASDVTTLDFVTAHEVAHQWWYGAVGSDAYKQPWLDESLTNWSSAYYMDEVVGPEGGLLARDIFISFPYRTVLEQGDKRLDAPVDTFDEEAYSAIVYGKGALMYDVLRSEIGDEKFWAFLRDYYAANTFGRADGKDWEGILAEHTDPKTAAAFVEKWVEGSNIRADDLPPGGPMQSLLSGDLSGIDINKLIPTPSP